MQFALFFVAFNTFDQPNKNRFRCVDAATKMSPPSDQQSANKNVHHNLWRRLVGWNDDCRLAGRGRKQNVKMGHRKIWYESAVKVEMVAEGGKMEMTRRMGKIPRNNPHSSKGKKGR